jgi:hypothetical protein
MEEIRPTSFDIEPKPLPHVRIGLRLPVDSFEFAEHLLRAVLDQQRAEGVTLG